MPRVCVLLADGFEEIEAIALIDVLRRAELEVVTLGVATGEVRGSHGITILADARLDDHCDDEWDAVILPGGMPGAKNLRDDARVQALLRGQDDAKRTIVAICAAPIALSKAGVLRGRKATSYPGYGEELDCGEYLEARVVSDGHVITSRAPGTAIELALAVVAKMRGEDVARTHAERMLVA
jgi:4-methyl-5(b-hydroxyethyl)-thiazole monophosphate biosynthesis